ncbi:MAG: Gfo/Idh/MocA family oxidoreductase, partial [bacterium]|nr:Gfo/Idh/MocA family oxidoreductase [bacterium]MDW8163305.1 Gfo/Idh/MocA family oxidoreductase [Candidatus Omnitrophota bacterium]
MDKIKIGIVGLGRSGWGIHCRIISQLPDLYEIVSVCDEDKKRLEEAKERFKCKTYNNFNDFLEDEDIELVVIATFSHLHSEQTIKALKKGKNVICE